MKYRYIEAVIVLGLSFTLTACFKGSNKTANNDGETEAQVTSLAKQSADSVPTAILDPDGLSADIAKLFGQPDATPVDVRDGDTVQSVISRLN